MALLEGTSRYGQRTLEDTIVHNIIGMLKHGLLEIGAFQNISLGQTNYLGQDQSRLSPVSTTGVIPYTIYRGAKHDWAWEQGIDFKYASGSQPIQVTGVSVNSTGYATGSLVMGSGFYVDYSRGQVVFGAQLGSGTTVQVAHTLRGVNVYPANGAEYRELEGNWRNLLNGEAIDDISYKAYMPAVFVEVSQWETIRGLQLGDRGKLTQATIDFIVYSNNSYELSTLLDIFYMLETKTFYTYDLNDITRPLNHRGELINPTGTYLNMVNNHKRGIARFQENAMVTKIKNVGLPLFKGRCRIGLELDTYPS